MKIRTFLLIAIVGILIYCFIDLPPTVTEIQFENHRYLLFDNGGVLHDPKCECRKKDIKLTDLKLVEHQHANK